MAGIIAEHGAARCAGGPRRREHRPGPRPRPRRAGKRVVSVKAAEGHSATVVRETTRVSCVGRDAPSPVHIRPAGPSGCHPRIRRSLKIATAAMARSFEGDKDDDGSEDGGRTDAEGSSSSSTSSNFMLFSLFADGKEGEAAREKLRLIQRRIWQARTFVFDIIRSVRLSYKERIGHPVKYLIDVRDRLQYIWWCASQAVFRLYQRFRIFLIPVYQVLLWMSYYAIVKSIFSVLPQSTFWYFFMPHMFLIGSDPGTHFKPFGIFPLHEKWWSWQESLTLLLHKKGVPFVNIARIPHALFMLYFVMGTCAWYGWVWDGRPFFGGYLQEQVEMHPATRWSAAFFGMNGYIASICTFVPMVVTDIRKFLTGEGEADGRPALDVILNEVGVSRVWEREAVTDRTFFYTLKEDVWRVRRGEDFYKSVFPRNRELDGVVRMSKRAVYENELLRYTMLGRTQFTLNKYRAGDIPKKLFGRDALLDLIFPRDMSITTAKHILFEKSVGDTFYKHQIWPAERKMTQNNIFDRIIRQIMPSVRPN